MDYNKTINLPQTEFPMRAGLPKREPEMLKRWQDMDIYNEMLKKNEGKPRFYLHDGPPFSNGNPHMGHAMNKTLKDMIVRSYAMRGYYTPYIPGWDNHGMPIESAIIKEQKLNHKAMSVPEFRSACHAYAQKYVDIQAEGFKRMGVVGDWEHPYLTMNPSFEFLAHGAVGMLPVTDNAEALETFHLDADVLFSIGFAGGTEVGNAHSLVVELLLLDDGRLTGHAVAVPTGDVGSVVAAHCIGAGDEVLDGLVQGVTHVDVAVGEGRAVMQVEAGLTLVLLQHFVVDVHFLPACQHLRLTLGQTGTHGELGLGQIDGLVVVHECALLLF